MYIRESRLRLLNSRTTTVPLYKKLAQLQQKNAHRDLGQLRHCAPYRCCTRALVPGSFILPAIACICLCSCVNCAPCSTAALLRPASPAALACRSLSSLAACVADDASRSLLTLTTASACSCCTLSRPSRRRSSLSLCASSSSRLCSSSSRRAVSERRPPGENGRCNDALAGCATPPWCARCSRSCIFW